MTMMMMMMVVVMVVAAMMIMMIMMMRVGVWVVSTAMMLMIIMATMTRRQQKDHYAGTHKQLNFDDRVWDFVFRICTLRFTICIFTSVSEREDFPLSSGFISGEAGNGQDVVLWRYHCDSLCTCTYLLYHMSYILQIQLYLSLSLYLYIYIYICSEVKCFICYIICILCYFLNLI